ncbi:unnamed protein product, partial [Iphiclides podalirius]
MMCVNCLNVGRGSIRDARVILRACARPKEFLATERFPLWPTHEILAGKAVVICGDASAVSPLGRLVCEGERSCRAPTPGVRNSGAGADGDSEQTMGPVFPCDSFR